MVAYSEADNVLDALGNQTRRDILGLLRQRPLSVGDIAKQLPVSRPAVSKQLRILQTADLVTHRTQGKRNIFSIQPTGFHAVRAYLSLFWDEALLNFKQFADANEPPTA